MTDQIGNINHTNIWEILLYFDQNREVDKILSDSEIFHENNFGGVFLRLKSDASVLFSITIDKSNSNLIASILFYPNITIKELTGVFPTFKKRYIPYDEEYYYSFENTGFKCIVGAAVNTDGKGNEFNESDNEILRMLLTWSAFII